MNLEKIHAEGNCEGGTLLMPLLTRRHRRPVSHSILSPSISNERRRLKARFLFEPRAGKIRNNGVPKHRISDSKMSSDHCKRLSRRGYRTRDYELSKFVHEFNKGVSSDFLGSVTLAKDTNNSVVKSHLAIFKVTSWSDFKQKFEMFLQNLKPSFRNKRGVSQKYKKKFFKALYPFFDSLCKDKGKEFKDTFNSYIFLKAGKVMSERHQTIRKTKSVAKRKKLFEVYNRMFVSLG